MFNLKTLLLIALIFSCRVYAECAFSNLSSLVRPPTLELKADESFKGSCGPQATHQQASFITPYLAIWTSDKAHKLKDAQQMHFIPLQREIGNFGFSKNYYWFKLQLRNISPRKGRWLLSTGLRNPELLEVFKVVDENTTKRIFHHGGSNTYYERDIDHRHIYLEMSLDAFESSTFYLHLKNDTGLRFVPKLLSYPDFYSAWRIDYLCIGLFLAALSTLIIVNLFQYLATLQGLYFHYSHFVIWSLVTVTQHSGLNYKFLWPDNPALDQQITTIIGIPMALAFFQVVRSALNLASYSPKTDRVLIGLMTFYSLLLPIALLFGLTSSVFMMTAYSVTPLGLLMLVIISVVSFRKNIYAAAYYLLAWFFLYLGLSIFSLMHSGVNILTGVYNSSYVYAFGILLEALVLFAALAQHLRTLHINNARNKRQKIELLEERVLDLKLIQKLNTEKEKAQRDNYQRSLDIASASHDFRQPLYAIRLLCEKIKPSCNHDSIKLSIQGELDTAETIASLAINDSEKTIRICSQSVSLSKLFNQLFSQNYAAAKKEGVRLRFSPTSLSVTGSSIILLRMLDNLIKNALRVARQGDVLCGVRRRFNGIEFQILDTGPGLTQSEFQRLSQPFLQGEANPGNHGLGLCIVSTLCEQQDYIFSLRSKLGVGSNFSIFIPSR